MCLELQMMFQLQDMTMTAETMKTHYEEYYKYVERKM